MGYRSTLFPETFGSMNLIATPPGRAYPPLRDWAKGLSGRQLETQRNLSCGRNHCIDVLSGAARPGFHQNSRDKSL